MRVTELALEDFRSYERIRLEIDAGITAFVGQNGRGKTNLLEAIHLLARGDSPRARRIHPPAERIRSPTGAVDRQHARPDRQRVPGRADRRAVEH